MPEKTPEEIAAEAEEKAKHGIPEPEISQAAIDAVDLEFLGSSAIDEIMGAELFDVIANYHRDVIAGKAARSAKNHEVAQRLALDEIRCRDQAALIQSKYPAAKAIAREIGEARAAEAKAQRAKLKAGD